MDKGNLELRFKYSELTTIWQNFCDYHFELLELTSQEYSTLLESDIEALEVLIAKKEILIENIGELELLRTEVVDELAELAGRKIEKIHDIYPLVRELKLDNNNSLENYNAILLNIIDDINDQNKKNQVFLNKAIISLQDLKSQFGGKKSYKTYNNKGNTQSP